MIGYHYSPSSNRSSIGKHGLLVPSKHPILTIPVTCSDGHRNPHISLGRTPSDAWMLSGGFLLDQCKRRRRPWVDIYEMWDLYEVDLPRGSYRAYGDELQTRKDITKSRVRLVGTRELFLTHH